jgi:hypothetical protein
MPLGQGRHHHLDAAFDDLELVGDGLELVDDGVVVAPAVSSRLRAPVQNPGQLLLTDLEALLGRLELVDIGRIGGGLGAPEGAGGDEFREPGGRPPKLGTPRII